MTFCPIINRAKLELDHGKTLIRAEYGYKRPVGFNARECACWHNDCFIYGMNEVKTVKGVKTMTKQEIESEIEATNDLLNSTRGSKKTMRLYARLDKLESLLEAK